MVKVMMMVMMMMMMVDDDCDDDANCGNVPMGLNWDFVKKWGYD